METATEVVVTENAREIGRYTKPTFDEAKRAAFYTVRHRPGVAANINLGDGTVLSYRWETDGFVPCERAYRK